MNAMGGISSGVGLISGIDTRTLIQQLLSLEARPKQQAQSRIIGIQRQSAAYLDVNSALLALKTAAGAFDANKVFKASKAVSSDTEVLSATASNNAAAGTYQFRVQRLVSTQQQLSRGFVDRDTTGVGATSFTFELGGGSLSSETKLSELNGGSGVSRGSIQITDRRGGSATIDLGAAVTIDDVLTAINDNSSIDVTASIDGDRLKIVDNTGVNGTLSISNAGGFTTATSLGIAGTASGAGAVSITGGAIRTISESTALSTLNDGNGVNIRDGAADLVITDRTGKVINVSLGLLTHTGPAVPPATTGPTIVDQNRATTVGDVISIINAKAQAEGSNVRVALNSAKTGLTVTDSTAGGSITTVLTVASGTGRTTAEDLGIATGQAGVAASTVDGRRLISGLNSTLVNNLRGGQGVTSNSITITDRAGNSKTITLSASALSGSVTDLIADINTKLADTGGGAPAINAAVSLNRTGNGLAITDTTAAGAVVGNLVISGSAATQLGLTTTGDADGALSGSNLQSKWLSTQTRVSSLNAGRGIGTGSFRITAADGTTEVVNIADTVKTVDDLIQFINSRPINVTASVNANGDGITITDNSAGAGKLTIADVNGTVAKSLNLVGEAATAGGPIVGSYERTVTFSAGDTLDQISTKINNAGVGLSAAVIRDGSGGTPFRLSFTAQASGSVGRAIIDTGTFDLGLQQLSRGDDAIAFFGAADPARAVLLTSSTNSLDGVVQGVNIDFASASDKTVELTVSRDSDTVESAIGQFVTAYNTVIDKLDRYQTYNQDTNTRGTLLGDTTADNIRQQISSVVQGTGIGVEGRYTRLFQVGVRVGTGGKLSFDASKFRTALQDDPQGVEDLFAASTRSTTTRRQLSEGVFVTESSESITRQGVAERLESLANGLTNSVDGVLTRRSRTLDDQKRGQERQIDSIDQRLARKQAKLELDFSNMERALAQLQSQQSALGRISNVG